MESMNELADDAQKTQYITKIIDKLDSVNKNLDDYLVTIDNLMSCNATLASNLKTASGEVSSASGKLNNGVAQVNKAKTDAQQTITTLQSQMDQVYQSIHTHLQEVNTTLSKELPTAEEIANAANNVSNSTQQIELLKQLLQSDLIPAGSNKDDIIKLLDSIEQTTTAVQGVLQNRIGDLNNAVSGDHAAIKAAANLIDAVMPIVEKQLQADVATMKAISGLEESAAEHTDQLQAEPVYAVEETESEETAVEQEEDFDETLSTDDAMIKDFSEMFDSEKDEENQ